MAKKILNRMNNDINYFNLNLQNNEIKMILTIIVILVIILLFRKNFNTIIEKLVVFIIIFLLFLIISKNLIITFIGTSIVFLLLNLLMGYKRTIESYQNVKEHQQEPTINKNIFETDEFKKSSEGIKELLKKVNGGIELKDDDLKETDKLGVDSNKYSDDKKPNILKDAQKEAYELIDTVNALKDTINTLTPVLNEGKKLMNIFQSLTL